MKILMKKIKMVRLVYILVPMVLVAIAAHPIVISFLVKDIFWLLLYPAETGVLAIVAASIGITGEQYY